MKTLTQYLTRFATAAVVVAIATPARAQVAAHQGPTLDGAKTVAFMAASNDAVTFFPAAKTVAAFAKGQPLFETGGYKVHASRRNGPGGAEVHTRDTDVIYVLPGTAVIVTGGTVVEGKTIAADEIRGARIDGGTQQALAKGDVLILPNGVPHWFKEVKAPFQYYVVKVTAPAMGGTR